MNQPCFSPVAEVHTFPQTSNCKLSSTRFSTPIAVESIQPKNVHIMATLNALLIIKHEISSTNQSTQTASPSFAELGNRFFSPFSFSKLAKFCQQRVLLILILISAQFIIMDLSGQTTGDFRSTATGTWGTSTTWQRFNGSAWQSSGVGANNPGQVPTASSSVFIQTDHAVTLAAAEACNDLHLETTNSTRLALATFTLSVNGKIRAYSATLNTIPGTSGTPPNGVTWITSTTGKIAVVGNTRVLTVSGEWGAGNAGTASPNGFDFELNLNSGQTVTANTGIKARSFNIVAGTLTVAGTNRLAPDTGAATGSNFTIQNGAVVESDQTGGGNNTVIGRTGMGTGGILLINSGATLRLTGASPNIGMTTITNNGTVEYAAAGNQTMVAATNSGAAMSSYTTLIISGSGVKTLALASSVSGTTTVNSGCTLGTGAFTLTNNGTANITGSFRLDQGGWGGSTGTYNYSTGGTLVFNNTSGSYGVNNGDTWWPSSNGPVNVTVQGAGGITMNVSRSVPSSGTTGVFLITNGTVTNGNNLALNGTTQINGGNFGSTPTYGTVSTLIYNTTYGTSNEWTGGASISVAAGSGIPANVQVLSGTVTLAGGRGVPGNVTITAGGLVLNSSSGDLFIGGNLTHSGTVWTNNNRAVVFVGTGTSVINTSANSGVQFFDYLLINKSSGSVQIGSTTNVTLNITAGSVLQFLNAGTLDLNGRILTLNNNGGNILANGTTGGATKSIVSSTGTGTIAITNNKTVSGTASGTLSTDANVNWILTGGMNFGNVTTINGTLQINGGGFVSTNAPTYGSSSTLRYNTASTAGLPYSRNIEWSSTSGAGYPNNVMLSNNTFVDLGANGGTGISRQCAGNLTIDAGSGMFMDFGANDMTQPLTVLGNVVQNGSLSLSDAVGGDLKIRGNYTRSGVFSPKSRAVTFDAASGNQTITGATTFDFLFIDKAAGNITLANDITITQILALTNGIIVTAANKVVVSNSATGSVVRTSGWVNGNLQRTVANGNNIFTIGTATVYAPSTINMTGVSGSVQILGNVTQGVHPNEATSGIDVTKKSDHYWTMTKSGAGTFTSYVSTFNNANTTNTGTIANYKVAKFDAPSTWSALGGSASGNDVTSAAFTSFSDFIIGEGSCVVPSLSTIQTNISCVPNNPTGNATVIPTGGSSPYTYLWNDGLSQTSVTATGLAAGTYTVTVTATGGCTGSTSVTIIGDTTAPSASIANNNGLALNCTIPNTTLTASGGSAYLWSNGATTAATTVSTAGTFTVTVTGANGCTASASATTTLDNIAPTPGITNNTMVTELSCAIPTINVTATGGTSYAWSGGATPTTAANAFTSPATYTVTVTTANDCTATMSIIITIDPMLPTVTCPSNAMYCYTEPAFALSGEVPSGGTYSGSGVSGNIFTASTAGIGVHIITYTYTIMACSVSCTFTITVTPYMTINDGEYINPANWAGGCVPPNPIPANVMVQVNHPMTNPVGNTIINNGTLMSSTPFINLGTYKGTGTFVGDFVNNGIFSPGN